MKELFKTVFLINLFMISIFFSCILGFFAGEFLNSWMICRNHDHKPAYLKNGIIHNYRSDFSYTINKNERLYNNFSKEDSSVCMKLLFNNIDKIKPVSMCRSSDFGKDSLYLKIFSDDKIASSEDLQAYYVFSGREGRYSALKTSVKTYDTDVFSDACRADAVYFNKEGEVYAAAYDDIKAVFYKNIVMNESKDCRYYGYVNLKHILNADASCILKAYFYKRADNNYDVSVKLFGKDFKDGADVTYFADCGASEITEFNPEKAQILKDRLVYKNSEGDFSKFNASLKVPGGTVQVKERIEIK